MSMLHACSPTVLCLQVAYQKASEFYEEANAANDAHAVHFIGRCLSQKVTHELLSACPGCHRAVHNQPFLFLPR